MIRFSNVTKTFAGGATAVDDLTLEAPAGQITVLVGPSGCGKTTSLRMINRMIDPTSGSITVDGQDISRQEPAQLRRGIGYVIQHAGLFPHRSVIDNIGTVPRLLGWSKQRARARALELLEVVGLPSELGQRYPAQLSGGQQQRVGVARALAADPPIMLMDEPFSAVDPVVREQLQDEFLRLQGELGKTIVFVTHDIDEAIRLGDQVAVFGVGGQLAQVAPPHQLLTGPRNDLVAEFVGRDRGYRALGFGNSTLIPQPEPTLRMGEPLAREGWQLVVDEQDRPLGWVYGVAGTGPTKLPGTVTGSPLGAQVTREELNRAGTLAQQEASWRALLDAALSSPSGRGVVVDEAGRLLGSVTGASVVAAIAAAQQDPRGADGADS